jgi:hypothetical protein
MRVHDLQGAKLDFWAAKAAGIKDPSVNYRPSSSWADGGPIVESERISVWRYPDLDSWHAATEFNFVRDDGLKVKHYYQGPTPLIAAMRCFIASKFGNEVSAEPIR